MNSFECDAKGKHHNHSRFIYKSAECGPGDMLKNTQKKCIKKFVQEISMIWGI